MAEPLLPVVLPPPLAVPALAETATTYRQLFSDQTRDAVFDRPGAYLAGYRFGGGALPIPAPAALRDQTVQLCDRQPTAFLCLVPRFDGSAEIRILHRLMHYLELPGKLPTGFNDRLLGLLGDICPNQVPVVDVSVSILHLATAGSSVPTLASMGVLMVAADAGPLFLGP